MDQENTWQHIIQSIMFTSSITFGLNQPLNERGVMMDVAARLLRIMRDLQGKKSSTKVKLCRTGKLNRTICRIGNFFGTKNIAWETKTRVCLCFCLSIWVKKWLFMSLLTFCLKPQVKLTHRYDKWSPVLMLTLFMPLERPSHVLQSSVVLRT